MKKATAAIIFLVLLSFAVSLWFYDSMPERMATHWGFSGEVDGYTDRLAGSFLIPCLLVVLALLFAAIPRIDPLKKNLEKFISYYYGLIVVLFLFLLLLHVQVMLWNAGFQVSPAFTAPVGIGILLFYIGILLEHAERNWFVGIRTPWTMSSDVVWKKTHKRGAALFKICAVISVIGAFSYYAFFFVIVPVIIAVIYLFAYSYTEFQKEKTGGVKKHKDYGFDYAEEKRKTEEKRKEDKRKAEKASRK